MNCENLRLSHKLNFTPLMQIRKNKIAICGRLFLAISDLKLKNLNENSIKNPSYSGDELISVKSLQDTKLYFRLLFAVQSVG